MLKTDPGQFGGGRKQEYTQAGIERLYCCVAGCDRKAFAQWRSCADQQLNRPFCPEHDVELNARMLKWTGDPDWKIKTQLYLLRMQDEDRANRMIMVDWSNLE